MELNIEQIMQEIREEIKARKLEETKLSFDDIVINEPLVKADSKFSSELLQKQVAYLNQNWNVPIDTPYYTSNGLYNHVKKFIKKMTRFIVVPLVLSQNELNASVTRAFNEMSAYIAEQELQIEKLTKRVEELERTERK